MKTKEKEVIAVPCPTCGANAEEKCELSTGLPRIESHRDRCLTASEKSGGTRNSGDRWLCKR